MNQNIDTDKILNTISTTIEDIKTNMASGQLSLEEKENLSETALKTELQAYKTKLGLELLLLSRSHPDISSRDVLIKMLSVLPSDIPKSFLPTLTKYILDKWEVNGRKIAA